MKKLFLLLFMIGLMLTACENNSDGNNSETNEGSGEAITPNVTIVQKNAKIEYEGGEITIEVRANVDYDVSDNASWLTVEKIYGGVLIIADPNPNTTDRSSIIYIYNTKYGVDQKIQVLQLARPYNIGEIVTTSTGKNGIVFASLESGSYKLLSVTCSSNEMTWGQANTWCSSNYGTGWKLPTKDELKIIAGLFSELNSSLLHNNYKQIDKGWYWSSTEDPGGDVFYVYLDDGRSYSVSPGRGSKHYVVAVYKN